MERLSHNIHSNSISVIQIAHEMTNFKECGDDFVTSLSHTKLELKWTTSYYNLCLVFKMLDWLLKSHCTFSAMQEDL